MTYSHARLICAINGHWWPDELYHNHTASSGRKVLRAQLRCQRPECDRVKTVLISARTYEIENVYYSGEQEKIALGTPRANLRREMIRSM